MNLQDRVAIVTGGSSGIGLAVAQRLARDGAHVVVGDIKPLAPEEAGDLGFEELDVTSEEAWLRAVDATVARFGRVDILVNNAGLVGSYLPIDSIPLEDWNRIIAIDQTGVFLGMRTVVPHMCSQRAGSIVNVSSIWGIAGASGVAAYQAAKGAVRTMSKNAAVTYAEHGVRVNSIHPGFIHTPMTDGQDEAVTEKLISATPLGRGGTADEVAAAVAFLASDESSYVTGTELVVDGGFLAI